MADNQQDKQKPAEKPVSLKPLKVEEALSDLLKVKPLKRADVGMPTRASRPGSLRKSKET